MRKLVTVVLAVVIVGTAGYFGALGWAQQRVEREVETGLAQMRASGGTVSHGPVEIELLPRKVRLTNVVAESTGDARAVLKIGRIVATGVGQPGAGRMSADRLEIEDLEFDGTIPVAAGVHVGWKIPRLDFEGYSGPTFLAAPGDGAASAVDAVRAALQQFTAVTAQKLTVPAMTVSATLPAGPPFSAEYGYSGITLRDVGNGRVGATTVDRMVAVVNAPAVGGGPGGFTAEVDGMETLDSDASPILAVLAGSTDDQYRRVYRKATTGSYTLSFDTPQAPVRMTIEGATLEDATLKPSKFPLERMITLFGSLPRAGEPADPQQGLAILEMAAGFYEGIGIANFEMRGMKLVVPGQDDFRIGSLRMAGFENGRLAEMSLQGLDGKTPQNEPVKVGRFALKGLGMSELIRSAARLAAAPGRNPDPEQLLGLLRVLDGIEMNDVVSPVAGNGKPVAIDTARISWGDYVGAFPTRVDAALRVTSPIKRGDGELFSKLVDAGMTTATLDVEAGVRWSEASGLLVLQPFTFKMPNLGEVEVKATVANVPRSALTLDPVAFMTAMAAAEAGPVEYSVRDLGVLDLVVADVARNQSLSTDEARRVVTEDALQPAEMFVAVAPELSGVVEALTRFFEAPGGKLRVTVTPKGHVQLMPAIETAQDNPLALLEKFRVEATASR